MDVEVKDEAPIPEALAVIETVGLRRIGCCTILGVNCRGDVILKPKHFLMVDGTVCGVILVPPCHIDEIGEATIGDVLANWQAEL